MIKPIQILPVIGILFLSTYAKGQTYRLIKEDTDSSLYFFKYSEGGITLTLYSDGTYIYDNYILAHRSNLSAGRWKLKDSIFYLKYKPRIVKSRILKNPKYSYPTNYRILTWGVDKFIKKDSFFTRISEISN